MANNVEWDTSSLDAGLKRLDAMIDAAVPKVVKDIGDELMRLSGFEVPFKTGMLQNSAEQETVDDKGEEIIVGYNKEYAARLHEHPEYHFNYGRKGKYLIDPLMKNLGVFGQFLQTKISEVLNTK